MNTALQCIMNCYELSNYFLKNIYKEHINMDNPIGTKGVLAIAYTNLLKNVYNGVSSTFSPWDFKHAISGFQTMFMGYQQHDTQEFLNYLLDGLHEDLNKVKKKPLVEKDDEVKEDKIKANEQWIGFLRRNQSILVELLYGQYKSTLHCPNQTCNNISVTFDPFLSLTLPILQNANAYEVTCCFMPYDIRSATISIKLKFNGECTIMALRNKIGKMLKIHPMSFFVIKTNSDFLIDQFFNGKMLVRSNNSGSRMSMMGIGSSMSSSRESTQFVLYQINPKFFYSKNNSHYKEENKELYNITSFGLKEDMEKRTDEIKQIYSEDYDEDNTGFAEDGIYYYSRRQMQTYSGDVVTEYQKMNVDDNMGFKDDFLKVIVHLNKYEYNQVGRRKKIILQRVLYMHKSWTTKKIHLEIFKFFFNIIVKKNRLTVPELEKATDDLNVDYEKYFKTYFGEDFAPDNDKDTIQNHENKKYPYVIRIRSIVNEAKNATCFHCKNRVCHDCLLPYSDEITLANLCSVVTKSATKEGELEIDNNFYYLSLSSQARIVNKDIMLELTWLDDYKNTVYECLNEIKEVDFKIQSHKKVNSVSLDDCFKNFMKYEKLEPQNEWYCSQCKTHQRATKKMEIYKSPPILILHLKRFTNNNKLGILVDYPIKDLDLTDYIKNNDNSTSKKYDLFAVSNHYGGMGGGHYVAYAQNYFNKKWYKFDDSHVQEIDESNVVKDSGYVLFYRRQDINKLDLEQLYNKEFENYEDIFKVTEKIEVLMEVDDSIQLMEYL